MAICEVFSKRTEEVLSMVKNIMIIPSVTKPSVSLTNGWSNPDIFHVRRIHPLVALQNILDSVFIGRTKYSFGNMATEAVKNWH